MLKGFNMICLTLIIFYFISNVSVQVLEALAALDVLLFIFIYSLDNCSGKPNEVSASCLLCKYLREPAFSEDFIEFFQDFLKTSDLHLVECEELIKNYAFSWRLYKKLLEKWAYLELEEKQGYSGAGTQLRDMPWVLICVKHSQSPSK